jgi:potassium channel LctB
LGKQAVGLLEGLGYTNLRYYVGGMAEWSETGGPVAGQNQAAAPSSNSSSLAPRAHRLSWLERVAGLSLERLVVLWLSMIVVFGVIYWVAGVGMGMGLQAGGNLVKADGQGFVTAIYFSFVTALSIGYGDVVPLGLFRIVAIVEGAAGLLIFGCVISKLVSRRQEELTEEIHQTTFEDRLDRVRTNLHLVFTDIGSVQQLQAEQGVLPELVLRRLESTVRVFRGELRAVHDLLYRCRVMPDEETMDSLLANLIICLQGLTDIDNALPIRSSNLNLGLRSIGNLAIEICGECVPHAYAPVLKDSMDQIQELARKIA